ncbi:MAG TPA: hypothetical protein VLN26_08290 [Gaiellaceae bacterium]|nr:hypothetical protein [Gaiellaceae bacterium]
MRTYLIVSAVAGLAVVALAVAGALLLAPRGGESAAPVRVAGAHGAALPPGRTVAILPKGSAAVAPARQGVHGVELVRLRSGAAPARAVSGTVVTDESCAPDAAGVSHCRNDIRLASGRTISVTHDHPMASIPCLSPGERVTVRTA